MTSQVMRNGQIKWSEGSVSFKTPLKLTPIAARGILESLIHKHEMAKAKAFHEYNMRRRNFGFGRIVIG